MNIVKYKGEFETEGKGYLVMEYIDGMSLGQLLKFKKSERGARGESDRLDLESVSLQLIQSVYCLHAHSIIHWDINPTNIMVDSTGTLSLIDFGFALFSTSNYFSNPLNKKHKEFVGTLNYTAPEVINRRECDSRMDIWSLGCVLFELLY